MRHTADPIGGVWYVSIHCDDVLPKDGGIWKTFDDGREIWDIDEAPERDPLFADSIVPLSVLAAVDRMCIPLDKNKLSGATADEDARCMAVIKAFINQFAQPAPVNVPEDMTQTDVDGICPF